MIPSKLPNNDLNFNLSTAAHCFEYEGENTTISLKNLTVSVDDKTYNVAKLDTNSGWNSTDPKDKIDVTIVTLESPVELTESVQIISIPSTEKIDIGEGFVVGWESADDETNSTKLTQLSATALNSSQCIATFPKYDKEFSDLVFCANISHPFCRISEFFYQNSSDGWTIVGILSQPICDSNVSVSMFTNIGTLFDWIQRVMD